MQNVALEYCIFPKKKLLYSKDKVYCTFDFYSNLIYCKKKEYRVKNVNDLDIVGEIHVTSNT